MTFQERRRRYGLWHALRCLLFRRQPRVVQVWVTDTSPLSARPEEDLRHFFPRYSVGLWLRLHKCIETRRILNRHFGTDKWLWGEGCHIHVPLVGRKKGLMSWLES